MSDATFHPFPRLPFEIRQQIWEDACFDWRGDCLGLRYIKLNEKRQLAPLNFDWKTTSPRNRSAYLWHAGLWMTCKESRDIAAKHWRKQGWPNVQENTKDKDLGDAIWFMTESYLPRAGVIHRKGDYEPWHQVVDPWQDIFCITADSWELLVRDWNPIQIAVADERSRNCTGRLLNIAVEFDPSWTLVLAKLSPDHSITDYPPPLAFLIRILLDLADRRNALGIGIVGLIERNVARGAGIPAQLSERIFLDCDHEYGDVSYLMPTCNHPIPDFLPTRQGVRQEVDQNSIRPRSLD
jgi:hypothetical protein